MTTEHRVRLIRVGQDQTIQIPKDFELPGEEVILTKVAGRLIVQPVKRRTLLEALEMMEPCDDEFPEIDDPPPDPVEI